MSHRRVFFPVLAASMMFIIACGQDPPPPVEPQGPTPEELEALRQDSIRMAREAAEAEARAREAEARAREAEAARREAAIAAARATLQETVYFDYDESEIRPDAQQALRQKVDILRANPSLRISIQGHADERGSTEYNLALGTRRAEAVRQFFTSFGLDASRFAITSYGEERPAAQGSNEEAWAQNRRAEFAITGGSINPGM